MSNKYVPRPLNTSDVELPLEILEIAEKLARNTHEVWSQGRLNDGWILGDKIDIDKRTHPSLISYEELTEAEKDYDRRTSQEAIKFLIKCGYRITQDE